MYIPLTTMLFVLSEFEKRLSGYSIKKYNTKDNLINVFLIDDSLVAFVNKNLSHSANKKLSQF